MFSENNIAKNIFLKDSQRADISYWVVVVMQISTCFKRLKSSLKNVAWLILSVQHESYNNLNLKSS